jgi:hypothetical protein
MPAALTYFQCIALTYTIKQASLVFSKKKKQASLADAIHAQSMSGFISLVSN